MNLSAELTRLYSDISLLKGRTAPVTPASIYVDPSNVTLTNSGGTRTASDSNPGTANLPLLTLQALDFALLLYARLRVPVDVFLLSDVPNAAAAPFWQLNVQGDQLGSVWIHGTQTILKSGVLTGTTAVSQATNALMTVTDATQNFDWTPYVKTAFFQVTSGPYTGYVAPIRNHGGLGTGTLGALGRPTPFQTDIQPVFALAGNESYQIIQPTRIPGVVWKVDGPYNNSTLRGELVITDCWTQNTTSSFSLIGGDGLFSSAGCIFGPTRQTTFYGSHVNGMFSGTLVVDKGGQAVLRGGVAFGTVFADIGLISADDFGVEGGIIEAGRLGHCFLEEFNTFNCAIGLFIFPQGKASLSGPGHPWWGTGNIANGTAVQISTDGSLTVDNSFVFDIAGTGVGYSDFQVGGAFGAGATSVSFFRADTGAFTGPVTCTFAHFRASYAAGGFNGNVIDVASNARMLTTIG